jgi:hypothetical protein
VREAEGEKELMRRYTFVVQVHPEGVATLENLSTSERIRLGDMEEVGPQIQRWLDGLPRPPHRTKPPTQLGLAGPEQGASP